MQPNGPDVENKAASTNAPAPQEVIASTPVTGEPAIVDIVDEPLIAWEASEYLQHDNGTWWYVAFFVVAAILIGFAILFKQWTFIPVVLVMAIAGIIHVRRPPRVLQYALDDDGLTIGDKVHPYGEFKSFSVIRDGAFFAVLLIPIRRFSPSTIVYFDEADGEAIVDEFGSRLPMENRGLDTLDKFLRVIRF